MKKRIIKMLFVPGFFLLASGCAKEPGTPKSLQEILKRNEVDGAGSTGSGNGATGTAQVTYQGVYAATVKMLLSKVTGWRTPSCATCNDGVPPVVHINNNCMRDIYVASAVQLAWAAESYARIGNNTQAASLAVQMNTSLQSAINLCSNAPGVGGVSCLTFSIFPC